MVAHAHDTLKSIFSFADFRGRQDEIVLLAAPTAVVNGFLVRPIALCVGGLPQDTDGGMDVCFGSLFSVTERNLIQLSD